MITIIINKAIIILNPHFINFFILSLFHIKLIVVATHHYYFKTSVLSLRCNLSCFWCNLSFPIENYIQRYLACESDHLSCISQFPISLFFTGVFQTPNNMFEILESINCFNFSINFSSIESLFFNDHFINARTFPLLHYFLHKYIL